MSFQLSISKLLDSRSQLKRKRKKKNKSLQHIVHFPLAQYLATPTLKICCHAGGIGCVHINVHINGNGQSPAFKHAIAPTFGRVCLVLARDFSVIGAVFFFFFWLSVKVRGLFWNAREKRAVEWFVKVATPHWKPL